jgi:hypothetical protein
MARPVRRICESRRARPCCADRPNRADRSRRARPRACARRARRTAARFERDSESPARTRRSDDRRTGPCLRSAHSSHARRESSAHAFRSRRTHDCRPRRSCGCGSTSPSSARRGSLRAAAPSATPAHRHEDRMRALERSTSDVSNGRSRVRTRSPRSFASTTALRNRKLQLLHHRLRLRHRRDVALAGRCATRFEHSIFIARTIADSNARAELERSSNHSAARLRRRRRIGTPRVLLVLASP